MSRHAFLSSGDFIYIENANPQENFYEWKKCKDTVIGGPGTSEVMK